MKDPLVPCCEPVLLDNSGNQMGYVFTWFVTLLPANPQRSRVEEDRDSNSSSIGWNAPVPELVSQYNSNTCFRQEWTRETQCPRVTHNCMLQPSSMIAEYTSI